MASILAAEDGLNVKNGGIKHGQNDEPVDQAKAIELVTSTWALVKPDALKHGIVFYKRLFSQHPELMSLFSFTSGEQPGAIEENPAMKRQARLLMNMISYAVRNLNNLTELVPNLKEMGRKHFVQYHVEAEHFQPVGESLLWTLKMGLGEIFTPDVEAAWTSIYAIMSDVMIEGGKEGIECAK